MQPRSLEDRVTLLEKNLQGLPERVGSLETQVTALTGEFVQFRGEVRADFSATREELRKEYCFVVVRDDRPVRGHALPSHRPGAVRT